MQHIAKTTKVSTNNCIWFSFPSSTMLSIHLILLSSFISGFSANTCIFNVKLHQELLNEGFHRNLTYKLTFQDKTSHIYERCHVALKQVLPPGVYASPDELQDLIRMNKVSAILMNRVNIELPAENSQPTEVFILGELSGGEVNLWLPVHARYHKAAVGGGLYQNKISQPQVFIRCSHIPLDNCEPKMSQISFFCDGSVMSTCVWRQITVASVINSPIQFLVPVGNLDHAVVVSQVTAGAVIVFSLYLLKTLHDYKMGMKSKSRKLKSCLAW